METLDRIPWSLAVAAALSLGLAPFVPQPHVVEKLRMLRAGTLRRLLDVLDLVLHGAPWALLALKALRAARGVLPPEG